MNMTLKEYSKFQLTLHSINSAMADVQRRMIDVALSGKVSDEVIADCLRKLNYASCRIAQLPLDTE